MSETVHITVSIDRINSEILGRFGEGTRKGAKHGKPVMTSMEKKLV